RGASTLGANRILATGVLFVGLALFATLLLAMTGEHPRDIGLRRPRSIWSTVALGIVVAGSIFFTVIGLESIGIGTGRLGDMASELKGDMLLLSERVAFSLVIVAFVEEYIFRGFILTRLLEVLGGSGTARAMAVVLQAMLFGLAHAYQHLFG